MDQGREYPLWIVPHSSFGDPDCPGLFFPEDRDQESDIMCNDCGFVLKTVPAADANRTMDELKLSQDVASGKCPHCGSVNLIPGFSRVFAFTCRNCGRGTGVRREMD